MHCEKEPECDTEDLCHMPQAVQLLGLLVQDEEERPPGRLLGLPPQQEGEGACQALWWHGKVKQALVLLVQQRSQGCSGVQADVLGVGDTFPSTRRRGNVNAMNE